MKVAVSIPDDVFDEAEQLVAQLKTSRSEVYARALAEFVDAHTPDRVTEAMNEVIEAVGDAPDPFVRAAQRQVFDRVEW